jgi:hypothetical protein
MIENAIENNSRSVTPLQLDYKGWSEARKNGGSRHHLTKTIAY